MKPFITLAVLESTGFLSLSQVVFTRPVATPVLLYPGSKSGCPPLEPIALKSRYTTGTVIEQLPCEESQLGTEHLKPVSCWQVAEQPSPPAVLPSSHTSPVST